MNSIGNQPAFPVDLGQTHAHPGMTYRQWLIGMCAQGAIAATAHSDYTGIYPDPIAEHAFNCADAILAVFKQEGA